jgi:CHAD domain-containing protein
MPTALKQGEPAMHGARRVLFDHIDRAIRTLQRHSLADEAVHEARKEMKRTRAGLRLLREALGETTYRRLNRSVRDAARPLTPIRDAKVLHDALENVLQQGGRSSQERPPEVRQVLQQERRLTREKISDKDLKAIATRLREVKRHLQRLPASRLHHAHTDAALERAYRKAYKAFALASREPGNEHLHEWRKQVKYHYQQLEFVQPLKPKRLGATIRQAHRLADHLGDDHDLALLHEKIALHATEAQSSLGTAATDALIKELKRLRAKLQRKAYRLGEKLYADKPKRVARQVGEYVDAWRSQVARANV